VNGCPSEKPRVSGGFFNTPFLPRAGKLKASRQAIARHYACSWLLCDLLCTIPFDRIFSANITTNSATTQEPFFSQTMRYYLILPDARFDSSQR
jgi:hypothetical protein